MARARTIKPNYFKNELLAEASPHARLLFIGLWCLADKAGRLEDRPLRIRAEVFPYETVDAEALLAELAAFREDDGTASFIVRYVVDGKRFIQIVNFAEHQSPHAKEQESSLPAPCKPGTCPVRVPDIPGASTGNSGTSPVQIPPLPRSPFLDPDPDRDEVGVETRAASSPLTPAFAYEFPCDGPMKTWGLTSAKLAEYVETYTGIDVEAEIRKALQWCRDNPAKRKTARGMPAFLTNWLNSATNRPRRDTAPSTRSNGKLPDIPADLQPHEARQFEAFAKRLREQLPHAQADTIAQMALDKLQKWRAQQARNRSPAEPVAVGSLVHEATKRMSET